LVRSYGTAVAVFALLGSLLVGVAEASVELAADHADSVAISPAYTSPAFVSSLAADVKARQALEGAEAPSLGPVAIVLPSSSVLTEETRMWGSPEISGFVPLKHMIRHSSAGTNTIAVDLTRSAMRFIGTPFVFGGTSIYGFDCSGYVQHVFAMFGMHIPRTADAQYYAGYRIHGRISRGDLVFFQTYLPGVSHVGIYLGNGRFIHASSHGVRVSSLSEQYWNSRYLGAKRLIAKN
jgi:cell wall-associated NlpC family hydrolase